MDYVKVSWKQNDPHMPLLLYSELDDERWEVRKVEVFLDGSLGYADRSTSMGTTFLGLIPLPSLLQIASMPEFEPVVINKDEFEAMWSKATGRISGT